MRVALKWNDQTVYLRLNISKTSEKLYHKLPLSSVAQTWGKEVYFNVPVHTVLDADACQVVEPGTVCFWVEGQSVAIPFGRTPASEAEECRLVTLVNVIGKVEGDFTLLQTLHAGDKIILEKA